MSSLGSIFGGINPQQLLQNMLQQNPQYKQFMDMAQKASGNDPQKAKELVIEKLKAGNINMSEFNNFKYMAKQLGVDDETLEELNKYVKQ